MLAKRAASEAAARAHAAQRVASIASLDGEPREHPLLGVLMHVPQRVEPVHWWLRCGLLALFAFWGFHLVRLDVRDAEIMNSFLHGPLLIFHEAGHVLFRLFGEFTMFLGGTLGQLLMPALIAAALLIRNRDPFGALFGVWLFGVSLLDVAPYVYDALDPQITLLSGDTGAAGGHDWIYLLEATNLLHRAHTLGFIVHRLGALVVFGAIAWGVALLFKQRRLLRRD